MSYDKEFQQKLKQLLIFKRVHGSFDVPSKPGKKWLQNLKEAEQKDLKKLGRFVESLRHQYNKSSLEQYKVDMLNHIGFTWVPKSHKNNIDRWRNNIQELEEFKEKYGHFNVPEKWEKNVELANFVASTRMCYKRKKLSSWKINVLKEIGFNFVAEKSQTRNELGQFISCLS